MIRGVLCHLFQDLSMLSPSSSSSTPASSISSSSLSMSSYSYRKVMSNCNAINDNTETTKFPPSFFISIQKKVIVDLHLLFQTTYSTCKLFIKSYQCKTPKVNPYSSQ